jgi:hypothetical protein
MMIVANADVARAGAEIHEPTGALVSDFIGRRGVTEDEPSSYLVEVESGYEIKPHFHGAKQYQVCVSGRATFMRKPMVPGTFHYADSYTTYGPIVAQEGGLGFLTLRQTAYTGFHEMPGSRDALKPSARRTFVGQADPGAKRVSACVELASLGDGTAVYQMSAGPMELLPMPRIDHGGANVIVQAGTVRCGDDVLPELSCLWVGPEDPIPDLFAPQSGAVVLFLSFARHDNDGDAK